MDERERSQARDEARDRAREEAREARAADAGDEERSEEGETEEEPHPRGTLFIMLLFLALIVALWGYVYWLMLGRGGS